MKKRKNSKGGMTMVEVIVAFAVLVLIIGIFSQAVGLAGRMMNRADDTLEGYRSLAGDYYMEQITPSAGDVSLLFADGNEESFVVSATERRFDGSVGALYDVVGETTSESPDQSDQPDPPDPPEVPPARERPFTTVGNNSEMIINSKLEDWQHKNVEGLDQKFMDFFNNNEWKNITASDGKKIWYRTFRSNSTLYALGGWEDSNGDLENLQQTITKEEPGLENGKTRVTDIRASLDTTKQGHIMESVSENQISGVTELTIILTEETFLVDRISFKYG